MEEKRIQVGEPCVVMTPHDTSCSPLGAEGGSLANSSQETETFSSIDKRQGTDFCQQPEEA